MTNDLILRKIIIASRNVGTVLSHAMNVGTLNKLLLLEKKRLRTRNNKYYIRLS